MNTEFIKHTDNGVRLTVASKSNSQTSEQLDEIYRLILKDVIKVVNMHGGVNGVTKSYKLCPRWEIGLNDRRDIIVHGIKPTESGFLGESIEMGAIKIRHDKSSNFLKDGFTHMNFDLGFEGYKTGFISPTEFYDLYKHELV